MNDVCFQRTSCPSGSLLLRIWEVDGSDLGQDIGYHNESFRIFLQFVQENARSCRRLYGSLTCFQNFFLKSIIFLTFCVTIWMNDQLSYHTILFRL
jgi:hypothetical protein